MVSEQRLGELPKAIIQWYEIEKGSKAACVVCDLGASRQIAAALEEKGVSVKEFALDRMVKGPQDIIEERLYDIVVAVDVIEYAQDVAQLFNNIKNLLKPDGKLLLAADNRLGIRYFCGDQDGFSGNVYDSVQNYKHLQPWERKAMKGRAYSKAELTGFLEAAGFFQRRFYSVFPRIENPQLILAEDYEPNEALDIRVFPEYNHPDTVFLFEEELYPSLMENKLLHPMANGFFVECPLGGEFMPINQVTLSGERGRENAMATMIRGDGLVEKRALYPEGKNKLWQLLDNSRYLSAHGVSMIPMEQKGDALVMPYVSGIPATDYLRSLLEQDKDMFLSKLDDFWAIVLHSSEEISLEEADWSGQGISQSQREGLGAMLKRGYLDLVSLNCFYLDGRFVFYDQELYLENVPAKAILLRTIEFLYKFHDHFDEILPRSALFARYGLWEFKALYDQYTLDFLNRLRGDQDLRDYFQKGRRDGATIVENRKWMNYSKREYHRIFEDIFQCTEGRKLYLFGSGKYAQRFRNTYGGRYPVTGYLDNDENRRGAEIEGLPVLDPSILKNLPQEEYKVIVCIRDYMPVVEQLRREKIANFSVYDPNRIEGMQKGER